MTPPEKVATVAELRARLDVVRAGGATVGFVPTMGYLHDGHLSLMRAARTEADVVVASIFVNPLQFAPDEDLDAYPRDLDGDTASAADAGVDVLFVPSVAEMYPAGRPDTTVSVAGRVTSTLEGASRPTHFAGVATVVAKLFQIVGPCRAWFGEKDFQQLAVIRRMVADLSVPVVVEGHPIVREADGLAMSSRNAYLSPDERAVAPTLHAALAAGRALVEAGETDPAVVVGRMADVLDAAPLGTRDYLACVDPTSFAVPERVEAEVRLLGAFQLGTPRLIDNLAALPPGVTG